ncbi:hypothetical protein JL720_12535 [Aureococcus anophagefferens]|nr:hypothetical protein JL720_12535 [Aureococcus anophagefferens]
MTRTWKSGLIFDSKQAHELLEGGPPDAWESQAPIPEGGAADGDATGFTVSCSVQCDGAACVAPVDAGAACLSSTLDDAFAVPSRTAACLFGLDRLEDEVPRARVAEARPAAADEAAPVDDGDLVVPEMGEWVESLVGDLDARLEPTDVEPLASGPGRGATASPHLSLASLASRGISRAKFAARRATSRRTLCSDSSKTTVRDCAEMLAPTLARGRREEPRAARGGRGDVEDDRGASASSTPTSSSAGASTGRARSSSPTSSASS